MLDALTVGIPEILEILIVEGATEEVLLKSRPVDVETLGKPELLGLVTVGMPEPLIVGRTIDVTADVVLP